MANTDLSEWILLDTDLTTQLAILPVATSHLYLEMSEPGSGSLKIPLDSTAAGLVTSGMFALCMYRGSAHNGFFIDNISQYNADSSEGGGRWLDLSGRGGLALLEDAIVWGDGTATSTREYVSKTKAYILDALITEAKARGGLGVLTYDFSATVDSLGNAWTDSEDLKINVGMSLLDLTRQFARTGIDFDITLTAGSFVLHAYKNGMGTDKSTTQYFRVGTNCEEVKSDERGDSIKNVLNVAYRDGFISVQDSPSISSLRRREELLDIKEAQTSASATTYAAAILAGKKVPRKTISVRVYDGIEPFLFLDYGMGDYIMLDVFGVQTKYRVLGIQADFDGYRYSEVVVEMNSLYYVNELRMSNDIDALKNQMVTAHDSDLLEVSYWAALGGTESLITTIRDIGVVGQKVFIGGNFTKIGGVASDNIIIYDIETGLFTGIYTTGWGTGDVYKIFVDGTDVYVGGVFDIVNNLPIWGLAKYDGAVWSEVGGGVELDRGGGTFAGGIVQSIEKIGDWLYISGQFDNVGVHTTPLATPYGVARYNLDTDTWEAMGNPGVGYNSVLLALGSDIYIGGNLTPYFKKWDGGTSWSAVGAAFDGAVKSLAVYGTNILAGGSFTGGIAEWDGAAWNVFNGGCVGDVLDIAVYLTDVYVVGSFTDIGNRVSKCSGGAWSQLTTGLDNTTNAIALHDSDVYVGGIFTQAGDKAAVKLAIYFTNFEALVDFVESSSNSFDMGAAIHAAQASAITDADEVPFWEDVSNALRKITWANIKAALDLLFVHLTGNETIAGTKTFTNTINVGVAPPSAGGNGSVNQTAEGLSAGNIAWTFGSTFASFVTGVFSRGTKAAPTAAQSGDVMLKVRGRAYDGAAYGNTSAEIRHVTSEAHAAGAHGTQIELWTTPNTTATMAKVLTVQNDGNINIEAGKTYNVNGVPVGGGGVSDGDKGDITVSGSGTVWAIDAKAVTLAKMDDMATASLIYRKTAGAGAPEVNTLATLKTDLQLDSLDLATTITDAKDPTGWLDPDAVAAAMTYDSGTQKISISGTHSYYWRGIKTSVTDFVSTAHDNTVGHQYYLSSGDGSTFTWATDTVWTFDVIMVAFVNFQTAVKFALAESHGLMQWQVHETLHQTIGTYKESGGTLDPATYTLLSTTAANRRPNVIAAHLHDEDVDHVLAALTSATYNKFYLSSTGINNFTGLTADIVPLLTNNPYYNAFATPNWVQTLMSNSSYMCVWLAAMPVTQDAASQAYRYIWIQGQANGNLASQEALQPTTLNLGTLSTESSEIVFLVKIIIRYTGGNWDLYSITNLTGSKFSQVGASAGNYLSAVTTNGSLTGDGTTASPLSASSGATTATAAGTTTLTVSSYTIQEFTGASTQTVVLPVVTTLRLGHQFRFINNSSGLVTVNSSGGNLVTTVAAGATVFVSCILITGTTAASWSVFNAAATYSTLASMSAANAAALVGGGVTALHYHVLQNYLTGLKLSNNGTDPTNDIDIAAGQAMDSTNAIMITGAAIIKRLDAGWAVGTNAGGLDTGAIANATYHVWLIKRSDTGVVDALFSTSASAPTMPANYDYKRRIGSIVRAAAAIKLFVQDGDDFQWLVPVADVGANNPGTGAVTRTLTLPTGIRVKAKISVLAYAVLAGSATNGVFISDLSITDSAPSGYIQSVYVGSAAAESIGLLTECYTNTSAQVRSRLEASNANTWLYIGTQGWTDRRGQDG